VKRRAAAVLVASVVALGFGLAPRAAWALCPNCLSQQATLTPTLKLLALFLLLPFALAAAVIWVVRRLAADRRTG
jgi:hypothetical protein